MMLAQEGVASPRREAFVLLVIVPKQRLAGPERWTRPLRRTHTSPQQQ